MKKLLVIIMALVIAVVMIPAMAIATVAGSDAASIGDNGYATLQDAFNAVKDSTDAKTITLLKDVNEAVSISLLGNNTILDLNGHKLTGDITATEGTYQLTIKDTGSTKGSIEGNIEIKGNVTFNTQSTSPITINGTVTLNNSKDFACYATIKGNPAIIATTSYTGTIKIYKPTVLDAGEASNEVIVLQGGKLVFYSNSSDNNTKATITGELNVSGSNMVQINGGNFTFSPNSEYLVEGCSVNNEADSTYTVVKGVAVINETKKSYTTLQEAINNAENNQTVKLLSSVILDNQLIINKPITLDGNADNYCSVSHKVKGKDDPKIGEATILVSAGATLKNLKVYGPNSTPNKDGIRTWDSGEYGIKLYNANGAKLENVTATVANAGIQVNGGSVTMTGNIDVSDNEFGGIEVCNEGQLNVSDATLINNDETEDTPVLWNDSPKGTITFSTSQHLYKKADSATKDHYYLDGIASVTDGTNVTYYTTLQEAYNDACKATNDNVVITLLKNANGPGLVVNNNKFKGTGKLLTLNLGGNTYSLAGNLVGSTGTVTNGFQLLKDNNITIKNGTIDVSNTVDGDPVDECRILIQNYANLTLDGVTLDGRKLKDSRDNRGTYTLSNNCGTVKIKDSTINMSTIETDKSYAFDVYYDTTAYAAGTQVEVSGTSYINGNVEVASKTGATDIKSSLLVSGGRFDGTFDVENGSKVKLQGGNFSSKVLDFVADGYNLYKKVDNRYYVYSSNPTPTLNYRWDYQGDNYYTEVYVDPTPYIPYYPYNPVTPTEPTTPTTPTTPTETTIGNTVVNNVTGNAVVQGTTTATVTAAALDKITGSLDVNTTAAQITLDTAAVQTLKSAAKNTYGNLTVSAVQTKNTSTEVRFIFSATAGYTQIHNFNGTVYVTVKLPYGLMYQNVKALYIDDYGKASEVPGFANADGTYTMLLSHFSEYAIMTVEEANKLLNTFDEAAVKALVSTFTVTTRTENQSRGIKVYVNDIDGLDKITDAGYTVVYDFYNVCQKKVPTNSQYKLSKVRDKAEGWYLNTAAKKGCKYYYKVILKVKDASGKVIAETTLSQGKYGCRTRK